MDSRDRCTRTGTRKELCFLFFVIFNQSYVRSRMCSCDVILQYTSSMGHRIRRGAFLVHNEEGNRYIDIHISVYIYTYVGCVLLRFGEVRVEKREKGVRCVVFFSTDWRECTNAKAIYF